MTNCKLSAGTETKAWVLVSLTTWIFVVNLLLVSLLRIGSVLLFTCRTAHPNFLISKKLGAKQTYAYRILDGTWNKYIRTNLSSLIWEMLEDRLLWIFAPQHNLSKHANTKCTGFCQHLPNVCKELCHIGQGCSKVFKTGAVLRQCMLPNVLPHSLLSNYSK